MSHHADIYAVVEEVLRKWEAPHGKNTSSQVQVQYLQLYLKGQM